MLVPVLPQLKHHPVRNVDQWPGSCCHCYHQYHHMVLCSTVQCCTLHHPVRNVDLAAVITTIINIMIIWTLGVVLDPGTRTGSRGEDDN